MALYCRIEPPVALVFVAANSVLSPEIHCQRAPPGLDIGEERLDSIEVRIVLKISTA
jgi:hypothetical protein